MKKIAAATIILLLSPFFSAHASGITDTFTSLAKVYGLPLNKEVFCAYNSAGRIAGYNDSDSVRVIPASISKLYTFDFALNTIGKNFRYTTDTFLDGTTLYLNGGGDPHFVIENLRSIVKKISNERHITISRFVFSPNFYFNWKTDPADVASSITASLKEDSGAPIDPNFSVNYSSVPYYGRGLKYQLQSAPLYMLIKQTNNWSNNLTADMMFEKAGGADAFTKYMQKTYGVNSSTIKFSTGSGLSGNYTTCGLTIKVMKHLEYTAGSLSIGIFNIMSVPRVDPGVLDKAFPTIPDTLGIVAKSGSVDYHLNYAGIAYTSTGPAYFAVFGGFSRLSDEPKAKMFDQVFIGSLLNRYKLLSFSYTPHNDVPGNARIVSASN